MTTHIGALCAVLAGAVSAELAPWSEPDRTWHAEVTIEAESLGTSHRESAVWQLEPVGAGFCIRVADVRQRRAGGRIEAGGFAPLQLEGNGWCLDPVLRLVGTDPWAGTAVAANAVAAGVPPEEAAAIGDATVMSLDLQQRLAGILLLDAWRGGQRQMAMPDGSSMRIDCRPQAPGETGERVVACELDAAMLRTGIADAAARVIGMDAGELADRLKQDLPDGPFVIVLQGRFAADTGLPESIAWIPDDQPLLPRTRFAFHWTRGPALAPELPLDPMRPWIEHPDPPPDANGSREPHYRANRAPPYPPDAISAGVEGKVVLQVLIGADGRVRTVHVKHSSGSIALDAAAQDDVAYWLFHPALREGVPVERTVNIPLQFQIPAAAPDAES